MQFLTLCCIALAIAGSTTASPAPNPLPKPAAVAVKAKPVVASVDETFFERCPNGTNWISYKRHCYNFFERPEYWYVAEQYCKSYGGNLVSILDEAENKFVSKLTYCQSAWTGRYAVNVDLLNSPSNYRWSANHVSSYHAHNFSRITSVHQPLISIEDMVWYNNVYHTRHEFVCKVPNPGSPGTPPPSVCPPKWKHLNGYCYLMSELPGTYIEADYFCRGEGAHVASLHNDEEVRAMSLLDLDSNGCPAQTWTGLVKLNPCRMDFSTGGIVCYRWSDRSGDYKDFPKWQTGSPNNDMVTNCIVLNNRLIRSVPCYQRHRFVCKKRA